MNYVVTPSRAGEIDRFMIETLKIPSLVLMEQAAVGIADAVCGLAEKGKVLVICGKGNNGGDGYAAARILLTRGFEVYVCALGEPSTPDSAANAELLRRLGLYREITEAPHVFMYEHYDADIIIDALFGTGLKRAPEGMAKELIELINSHPAKVVSADIPSGVFGATGQAETAVNADVTVTFQYAKPGHYYFPGREHTGKLIIKKIGVDLGITPSTVLHAENIILPKRAANTNKGSYGCLSVIAGKRGMTGAAVLCARAAIAAGSGLTKIGTAEFCESVLQRSVPEAMTCSLGEEISPEAALAFASGAIAVGPGLGTGENIAETLRLILPLENPKVVDADALNVISAHPELKALLKGCVLTPHPKELSRLTGKPVSEILSSPFEHAMSFSKETGAVVLLKGATTTVCHGERAVIVTDGSPSMAKGGSGDVLTGVIGALLAQGFEPFEAAYTAAHLCGKAGERASLKKGEYSASPMDTVLNLNL